MNKIYLLINRVNQMVDTNLPAFSTEKSARAYLNILTAYDQKQPYDIIALSIKQTSDSDLNKITKHIEWTRAKISKWLNSAEEFKDDLEDLNNHLSLFETCQNSQTKS